MSWLNFARIPSVPEKITGFWVFKQGWVYFANNPVNFKQLCTNFMCVHLKPHSDYGFHFCPPGQEHQHISAALIGNEPLNTAYKCCQKPKDMLWGETGPLLQENVNSKLKRLPCWMAVHPTSHSGERRKAENFTTRLNKPVRCFPLNKNQMCEWLDNGRSAYRPTLFLLGASCEPAGLPNPKLCRDVVKSLVAFHTGLWAEDPPSVSTRDKTLTLWQFQPFSWSSVRSCLF